MLDFLIKHPDKLIEPMLEHLFLVLVTLVISLAVAFLLMIVANVCKPLETCMVTIFSLIYATPSLSFFALLIPFTGLGTKTTLIVLVIYSQYLLLMNFMDGINDIDPAIIEAATGMGMTKTQVFLKVKIPLSIPSIFTGIRLATISAISMATIAATINAGGLGELLFEGLTTFNTVKIIWGSILATALALMSDQLLKVLQRRWERKV